MFRQMNIKDYKLNVGYKLLVGVCSRKGSKREDYVREHTIPLVGTTCVFLTEQVRCARWKNPI